MTTHTARYSIAARGGLSFGDRSREHRDSVVAVVDNITGRTVAFYERNATAYRASTEAWVIDPETGGSRPVYDKGAFRTTRAHWAARVLDTYGVTVR